MEALLGNGDTQSAQHPRLELGGEAAGVQRAPRLADPRPGRRGRLAALGSAHSGDAGLLIDRAAWMRDNNRSAARASCWPSLAG